MNKPSTLQLIILISIIILFLGGKAWVLTHPKSMIAIILGAVLLVFSEPAEAGG